MTTVQYTNVFAETLLLLFKPNVLFNTKTNVRTNYIMPHDNVLFIQRLLDSGRTLIDHDHGSIVTNELWAGWVRKKSNKMV